MVFFIDHFRFLSRNLSDLGDGLLLEEDRALDLTGILSDEIGNGYLVVEAVIVVEVLPIGIGSIEEGDGSLKCHRECEGERARTLG